MLHWSYQSHTSQELDALLLKILQGVELEFGLSLPLEEEWVQPWVTSQLAGHLWLKECVGLSMALVRSLDHQDHRELYGLIIPSDSCLFFSIDKSPTCVREYHLDFVAIGWQSFERFEKNLGGSFATGFRLHEV